MTSVTIGARDRLRGLSHLIPWHDLGQSLHRAPFPASPAIVPGPAEDRLPEASRGLECIMKSPARGRKGLCVPGRRGSILGSV